TRFPSRSRTVAATDFLCTSNPTNSSLSMRRLEGEEERRRTCFLPDIGRKSTCHQGCLHPEKTRRSTSQPAAIRNESHGRSRPDRSGTLPQRIPLPPIHPRRNSGSNSPDARFSLEQRLSGIPGGPAHALSRERSRTRGRRQQAGCIGGPRQAPELHDVP